MKVIKVKYLEMEIMREDIILDDRRGDMFWGRKDLSIVVVLERRGK